MPSPRIFRALLVLLVLGPTATGAEGDGMTADGKIFEQVLGAALAGDRQALADFAKAGKINALDTRGLSPVLHALRRNRLDAMQALLEAGADVDAHDPARSRDVIDQTAFLYAGATGNSAALKQLIAAKARTDLYNFYGGTALIPAAEKGHVEAVRLLLQESSVDVNHVNRLGWTALMEAVVLSDGGPVHQQIVALLLRHGADPGIADGNGITALEHARSMRYAEIVRLLESHVN